jgi:rare lipoprotein A
LLTAACGSRRAAATVPAARIGSSQEGIASWYGEPYHGRRAANGEIYDMDKPTAAHPSLPFETWVRVHSLASRKNTDVRITDRGPFIKGRIIDLSRAAARDIDLIRDGTARVRVTVIDPPAAYLRGRQFTIQVSSLPTKPRAELLRKQLAPRFPDVAVRYRPPNPKGGHSEAWRVLVGREPSPAAAARLLLNLQDRFPNAFIVPWDTD